MGKSVTNAVRFRDPIQPDIGLDRELFVLTCDDGAIYEFQKIEDAPLWEFRARGEKYESPEYWETRRAPLPGDVKATLDEIVGDKSWEK